MGYATMSASPSVSSVYAVPQKLDGALYFAISQSGKSPDLIGHARAAQRAGGAQVVALVNVEDSPLAAMADSVVPLRAGPEKSVAATKSYLCTLSAIIHIVVNWNGDTALGAALSAVPQALREGWNLDWTPLVKSSLTDAQSLFVVGRGLGWGSSAGSRPETQGNLRAARRGVQCRRSEAWTDGPAAGDGFPVLFFTQDDDTVGSTLELAHPANAPRCDRRAKRAAACASRRADPTSRVHAAGDCRQLLSRRQCTGAAARAQSGLAAASAQGHGDGVVITALVHGCVLTEEGDFQSGLAVLIAADRIVEIVADSDPRVRDVPQHDLGGRYLVPGFIDCQVNGGGGVLFNDAPTVETIRRMGAAHSKFGTTGFLPTLISDDNEVMRAALIAVDQAIAEGVPGVLGIHLEGPFLSAQRHGIHNAEKFRDLTDSDIDLVCSLTRGKTLLTLAPERINESRLRSLAARGVIVAAGHTAADYATMRRALAAGVRGFTHLFNARRDAAGQP